MSNSLLTARGNSFAFRLRLSYTFEKTAYGISKMSKNRASAELDGVDRAIAGAGGISGGVTTPYPHFTEHNR
ncbi:hypothetical protein [Burkholderia ubonensis]|uniref:hypothetical protein n=1 Tax=Burkholderia ubonensis TaxID=101571 RepID=UPI000F57044C|nr:hypothetical protein [Burkholderia ubonensis]